MRESPSFVWSQWKNYAVLVNFIVSGWVTVACWRETSETFLYLYQFVRINFLNNENYSNLTQCWSFTVKIFNVLSFAVLWNVFFVRSLLLIFLSEVSKDSLAPGEVLTIFCNFMQCLSKSPSYIKNSKVYILFVVSLVCF